MLALYSAALYLLYPVYRILTYIQPDFREFHAARQRLSEKLKEALDALPQSKKGLPVFWLHGSSAGELDQALALARAIKKRRKCILAISVFSKSVQMNAHEDADIFFRFPLDFKSEWKKVIETLQPRAFITMTWDIWPNQLQILKQAGVPAFLSSAALSQTTSHLRWPLNSFYKKCYSLLGGIGAVDQQNANTFELLAPAERITVTGDSRYDAIVHKLQTSSGKNMLPQNKKIVILASTYKVCDSAVMPCIKEALDRNYNVFIFPHHINSKRLQEINARLTGLIPEKQILFYSNLKARPALKTPLVIIVDKMGLLAEAYRTASFCYVGGALHNRIHNTGEPAACGIPVLSGPLIDASPVALSLEKLGALFRSATKEEFCVAFRNMSANPAWAKKTGGRARKFIQQESGASGRFYQTFLKDIK
jgi:3-deoxy-D-manno-octulosonic-acid transferase